MRKDHRCECAAGDGGEHQELRRECDGEQRRSPPPGSAEQQCANPNGNGERSDATAVAACGDAQRPDDRERGDENKEEAPRSIDLCGGDVNRGASWRDRERPIGEPGEKGPAARGEDGEAAEAAGRLRAVGEQQDCGERTDREAREHHPVDEREGAGDDLSRHGLRAYHSPRTPYPAQVPIGTLALAWCAGDALSAEEERWPTNRAESNSPRSTARRAEVHQKRALPLRRSVQSRRCSVARQRRVGAPRSQRALRRERRRSRSAAPLRRGRVQALRAPWRRAILPPPHQ